MKWCEEEIRRTGLDSQASIAWKVNIPVLLQWRFVVGNLPSI